MAIFPTKAVPHLRRNRVMGNAMDPTSRGDMVADMMWVLVLIAWNGTLATVPGFSTMEQCQSAGEAWRIEAKDTVSSPRWVCFQAPKLIGTPVP